MDHKPTTPHSQRGRYAELLGDLIGALSIFGTGWLALLIGHGFGLN